jgi:uncharacterized protein YndB with AHSA1/START domain
MGRTEASTLRDVEKPEQITVSRSIDAPIERIFAMLADPDTHPRYDGSGSVRESETHVVLSDVGDMFTMRMHRDDLGDFRTDNVVTTFDRDAAIGWAPAPVGESPIGHTFTYRLDAQDKGRTLVTLVYDWSSVTDERVLPRLPMVSAEQLERSLELLAQIL